MGKTIIASNEEIRLATSSYLQTLKNFGLEGGELSEIQMCLEQYTGCAYTLEKRSGNSKKASTEKSENIFQDIVDEKCKILTDACPQLHSDYEDGYKIRKYPNYWNHFWHNENEAMIHMKRVVGSKVVYRNTMDYDTVNETIRAFNAI